MTDLRRPWRVTLAFPSDPGRPPETLLVRAYDRAGAEDRAIDKMDSAGWTRSEWEISSISQAKSPERASWHG